MKAIVNELYRFRMLMTGVYVGLGVSSCYTFSIFTEHLRSRYNFAQSDITTISTVGSCIGFLSFFSGMLFDYGGPRAVFPLAAVLGFLGFLLFGLAFSGVIKPYESRQVNMILFCIFNAIIYLACPAMDASTVMPLMLNFPIERGYMVIIQKTFSGLGTSVLMVYFNGWFFNPTDRLKSDYAGFCYFLAAHLALVALLGYFFIDFPPFYQSQYRQKRLTDEEKAERAATLPIIMSQPAPRRRIYIGVGVVLANFVFITVSSIASAYVPTSKNGYIAISVIMVFLLACFSIMAMPFQFLGPYPIIKESTKFRLIGLGDGGDDVLEIAQFEPPADSHARTPTTPEASGSMEHKEEYVLKDEVEVADIMMDADVANKANAEAAQGLHNDVDAEDDGAAPAPAKASSVADPQYHGSFWSHLLTLDIWLLWFGFFGMWGTSAIMQFNAAQMYRSINYGGFDTARVSLYLAIIGVGSAIGRMLSGFADMRLSQLKAQGRTKLLTTMFLPVGPFLVGIGYLLFAVVPAGALILPFLVCALGTGVAWGLGVLAVRIMYAEDIGKHYSFMFSAGFVCTIALNRFMFGGMYDNEAKRLGTAPACNKPSCVRNQMFILLAVNMLSTVTSLIAHIRYSRYVAKHRAAPAVTEPIVDPADTFSERSHESDRSELAS